MLYSHRFGECMFLFLQKQTDKKTQNLLNSCPRGPILTLSIYWKIVLYIWLIVKSMSQTNVYSMVQFLFKKERKNNKN